MEVETEEEEKKRCRASFEVVHLTHEYNSTMRISLQRVPGTTTASRRVWLVVCVYKNTLRAKEELNLQMHHLRDSGSLCLCLFSPHRPSVFT